MGADSKVVGKDARLAAAAHITGKVTAPGGASLQGVYVMAYRKAPGQSY